MRVINPGLKKLKGFTMIELIIVLIVSGILITICLTVYTNFSRYINNTLKEQASVNKVVWFALRLKEDIYNSDYISGNSATINVFRSGRKTVYDFYPNEVLISRNDDTAPDTVLVDIKDINVGYIRHGIINYIEFLYSNEGNVYTFSGSKKYSVRFLFDNL